MTNFFQLSNSVITSPNTMLFQGIFPISFERYLKLFCFLYVLGFSVFSEEKK